MLKWISLFFIITFFYGCAARPQMTRDQWIDNTNRVYSDVTMDQMLLATEKVLRLSDGDDYRFFYEENGFFAERRWVAYMVFAAAVGVDYWLIKVTEDGDKIRVNLTVNSAASGVAATPVVGANNSYVVQSASLPGARVDGNALYSLYWSRLDYILEKNDEWLECNSVYNWVKFKKLWGDFSPLCNIFNVKDDVPQRTEYTGTADPKTYKVNDEKIR